MQAENQTQVTDPSTGEILKPYKHPVTGEIFHYTAAQWVEYQKAALALWQEKKTALAKAEIEEMQMRLISVAFLHDEEKTGKTETVSLGNGFAAKLKVPEKYTFVKDKDDKIDKAAIEKALSKIEKDGEAGALIAERLVKWTPALSLTEYKLLPPTYKKIIDGVLIVSTDGAPTLEVVEEKKKK